MICFSTRPAKLPDTRIRILIMGLKASSSREDGGGHEKNMCMV
jgi:hypothetical protein